jgi:hypothetical protein
LNIEAAHPRKPDVENQTARPVRRLAREEIAGGSEGLGTQANGFQKASDGRTDVDVIIDDEHRGRPDIRRGHSSCHRVRNRKAETITAPMRRRRGAVRPLTRLCAGRRWSRRATRTLAAGGAVWLRVKRSAWRTCTTGSVDRTDVERDMLSNGRKRRKRS